MKKYIILFAILFLWSCGKHTNVNEHHSANQNTINQNPKIEDKKDAEDITTNDSESIEITTEESIMMEYESKREVRSTVPSMNKSKRAAYPGAYINNNTGAYVPPVVTHKPIDQPIEGNTEDYTLLNENEFKSVGDNPLSTFSIDVDNASYTNCRRYLKNGTKPPVGAVRIEEFINFFDYDYGQPQGKHPFNIYSEYGECPWNNNHRLLHVGIKAKDIPFEEIAPMNLVFLLDVSGSMSDANKLPLLKRSLTLLTSKLRPSDKVSIVVYAGAAGLVLPPTPGNQPDAILNALDALSAGGSTAGGQGLMLAYKIAEDNFIKNGNNRIILATDGDFNVGVSSDAAMKKLVEEKRDKGVYITVLGFGMGNYKDNRMEIISQHGNGNYFYIDEFKEARRVLYDQLGSTLYAIAKDVKIQIEFNPNAVKGYRLIGYENRIMNKEDFNDDKKDAGELGAGHTVTAIYEIIPIESSEKVGSNVDPLKYQQNKSTSTGNKSELMTVKFRYKPIGSETSILVEHVVKNNVIDWNKTSKRFQWSASVAGFGMLLKDSKFKGNLSYNMVYSMSLNAKNKDLDGHETEFIQLVNNFTTK